MKDRKFDLEDRLIDFAVRIVKLSENFLNTKAGNHISNQILRSGTSPAPNYGEAQGAESIADFVHKMKISLKELRETYVWLKIIRKTQLIKPVKKLDPLLTENNELISIFVTSIETAKKYKFKK